MRWPVDKVYITQKWGVNGHIYSRFGYKGHNGIDLRLFDENGNRSSTALVYAPHDGVVKERRNDEDGYGLYLKIENDTEGSILGHLKEFRVNINKHVKKGDLIAIADNTGWSTGAHLHWGYYRFPRNRNNGYGGTIDQTPYIKEDDMPSDDGALQECLKQHKQLVDETVELKKEIERLRSQMERERKDFSEEKEDLRSQVKEARDEMTVFARNMAELLKTNQSFEAIRAKVIEVLDVLDNHKELVRNMSQVLNTTQKFTEMLATAEFLMSNKDVAKKAEDKLADSQLRWDQERIELQGKIDKLKLELNTKNLDEENTRVLLKATLNAFLRDLERYLSQFRKEQRS